MPLFEKWTVEEAGKLMCRFWQYVRRDGGLEKNSVYRTAEKYLNTFWKTEPTRCIDGLGAEVRQKEKSQGGSP